VRQLIFDVDSRRLPGNSWVQLDLPRGRGNRCASSTQRCDDEASGSANHPLLVDRDVA